MSRRKVLICGIDKCIHSFIGCGYGQAGPAFHPNPILMSQNGADRKKVFKYGDAGPIQGSE